MTNAREQEITKLIQAWAEHGAKNFAGKERTKEIEAGIKQMMAHAFTAGKQMMEGLGGQKFGFVWDKENKISVHQGKIPKGALIMKV